MSEEGWAIPLGIETWKYHYFRKGRSLCGRYYYKREDLITDEIPKNTCAICLRNLKYGDLQRIVKILQSKKYHKLIKVAEKYGNHLQYSLEQHFQHLFSEVEELKQAIEENDINKIIEELVDLSNMCDLTYDKIKNIEKTAMNNVEETAKFF